MTLFERNMEQVDMFSFDMERGNIIDWSPDKPPTMSEHDTRILFKQSWLVKLDTGEDKLLVIHIWEENKHDKHDRALSVFMDGTGIEADDTVLVSSFPLPFTHDRYLELRDRDIKTLKDELTWGDGTEDAEMTQQRWYAPDIPFSTANIPDDLFQEIVHAIDTHYTYEGWTHEDDL